MPLDIGHYQKDEFWEFLNRFISFSPLCGAAVASSGDDTMHDSEVEVWAPNEIQGDAKIPKEIWIQCQVQLVITM